LSLPPPLVLVLEELPMDSVRLSPEGRGMGAERSGVGETRGGAAARWKQFRADGPSLFALDSMGPNATACPQSCEI